MASREKKERMWAEAKRRCRLNGEEIGMAKKLGMNPGSLIKNIPAPTERWKAPVKVWVRDLFEKRFKKLGQVKHLEGTIPQKSTPSLRHVEPAERPLIWDTQLDDLVEDPSPNPAPSMEREGRGSEEIPF
jgi:hypothetical protein